MQRVAIATARAWHEALGAARQRLASWAEAESGRFALWLPVLMLAGAVTFFSLRAEPPRWLAPALLAGGGALLWGGRRSLDARAAGAAALAAALGFGAAQFATWRAVPLADVPTRASMAEGTVQAVEPLPQGRRVTLEGVTLDGVAFPRTVRLRLRADDTGPVEAGDRLRVRALLLRPAAPAYPGGWDLQRDAFFSGLGAFGNALGPMVRLSRPGATGVSGRIEALREAINARLMAALPGSPGPIAVAMLTGSMSGITEADRLAFRDSGLFHLLSISGLHIATVVAIFFGVARLGLALSEWVALHWPIKQVAALAALAGAGFYTVLSGVQVPVLRCLAMAALVTLGLLVGRRALTLRGLGFAMALLVLAVPSQVMGPSFQMSFAAVLALIAGFEKLRPAFLRLRGEGSRGRRALAYVVGLMASSMLAGSASAPFAAYHFGQAQVYQVAANLIAVPLTEMVVMPLGVAGLFLMPFGAEALALVPMGWGLEAVLWVGRAVAAWPGATIRVPHMPSWGLALFAFGLVWMGLWRTRIWLAGGLAVALGLASPAFERPPDLLLSADGRMIGLRAEDGMFVQPWNGPRITQEAWQGLWQARLAGPLGCGLAPCWLRARPDGPAAVLVRGEPPATVCAAAVVVSLEPVRLGCRVPVVDRFSVWREGAHAIWLDPGGARVLSDRQYRGERIWMPRPTTRSRLPPGLVPALPEELPEE
ncbi:ComEC/Rec2 family competence protein [Rhodovastum atsumiense]|uniref:ComEC/Rec2 family competence protein n=1 Tax=Rhodovastum atsumiense TaxID=504468 RepID=A0A5M6J4V9_9PROT|nr:ComEC/Rec2 family competence protein [Rhodovastum atsumiense]KAA5614665.1 ComEC/Rec2 family competence protein [Rhodovastum atsumiense]CAH2599805.1 ComEC/Rec2 family competence protein [Rhodovastum atsumiense]